MSKFNIGDKVRVVNDQDSWLDPDSLPHDTILTICEDFESDIDYVSSENLTIQIEALRNYPEDFEKVTEIKSENFVPKVEGTIGSGWSLNLNTGGIASGFGLSKQLFAECGTETIITMERAKELGMYRPKLEDRKVGKVRVELVDKGFPNALWEVARLMTKAQEVKGYADHDWKNLPNWQESFSAAASRHRMKHNKGEFFDDEFEDFKILHKVNEAFNVLAELELLIVKRVHE
jgi:hypothetical protein